MVLEFKIKMEDKGLEAHCSYQLLHLAQTEYKRIKGEISDGWIELSDSKGLITRHETRASKQHWSKWLI